MVKCAALTNKFRPCRGHADPETDLCRVHADWWDDQNWLYFLMARVNYFSTDQQLKWARHLLLHPRAVASSDALEEHLNERWAANQGRRYSYLVWYTILVETERIHPMKVHALWIEKVRPLFGILSDMITIRQPTGGEAQAREYIRSNLMHYLRCDSPIIALASLSGLLNILSVHIPKDSLIFIVREIADQLPLGDTLFQDLQPFYDVLNEVRQKWFADPNHTNQADAEEVFKCMVDTLNLRRTAIRQILRETVAPMKEELAARAFRPERIEALINTYGQDILDTL